MNVDYPELERYTIISKIGHGGMGDVFRAFDTRLERECAIKRVQLLSMEVFGGGNATSSESDQRVKRELRIMSTISHPNIVSIFDAIQKGGQLFIVMELCQLSTADWIAQCRPFALSTALEMTIQVLSALAYLHEEGIVHRDIKPHNILISVRGDQFKLTDFGLASLRDSSVVLTQTGVLAGTVAFMAPEQRLSFHDVVPQSDLYSLAMTLVWWLFGQTLGDLYSPHTQQILREKIVEMGWPESLMVLFMKAGAERPGERFVSAKEMKTEIEQIATIINDGKWETLSPSDFESVQRFETAVPRSASQSVPQYSNLSTEQLQAQTSRWLRGLTGLLVLVLVLIGLLIAQLQEQRLPVSTTTGPLTVSEAQTLIPQCDDAISTQHQFRKLGPRETTAVTMVDVDGDTWLDVVYTNQLDKSLTIYWGNEGNAFESPTELAVGRLNNRPLVGDLNLDGRPDLVTLHSDQNMIRTWLSTGDRTWSAPIEQFQAPAALDGNLTDLNGDGILELLFTVAGESQNLQVRFWELGEFQGHTPIANVPGLHFVRGTPDLIYQQEQAIFRRTVRANKTLSIPEEITTVDSLKHIQIIKDKMGDVLYGLDEETQRVVRLSSEPCWLLEFNSTNVQWFQALGDWNRDGYLDWAGSVTCAECTSNHLLFLGGPK